MVVLGSYNPVDGHLARFRRGFGRALATLRQGFSKASARLRRARPPFSFSIFAAAAAAAGARRHGDAQRCAIAQPHSAQAARRVIVLLSIVAQLAKDLARCGQVAQAERLVKKAKVLAVRLLREELLEAAEVLKEEMPGEEASPLRRLINTLEQ